MQSVDFVQMGQAKSRQLKAKPKVSNTVVLQKLSMASSTNILALSDMRLSKIPKAVYELTRLKVIGFIFHRMCKINIDPRRVEQ